MSTTSIIVTTSLSGTNASTQRDRYVRPEIIFRNSIVRPQISNLAISASPCQSERPTFPSLLPHLFTSLPLHLSLNLSSYLLPRLTQRWESRYVQILYKGWKEDTVRII